MYKKILSISALSVSALLLILSVVDVFADKVVLFDLLPLKLAVVLMLLLALAVTAVACIDGSWRRPLLLLACLLQTPVAGAMAVVWVYGLCFPEVMPLQALFPFLVALTALASVIQSVVMIVGEGMYEPEDGGETENDSAASADAPASDAEEVSAEDSANASEPEKVPASAPSAPAAPPRPTVKAMPRKALLTSDELEEAEDDLAPIPKKKKHGQPAPAEKQVSAPAPAPHTPSAKPKTEPAKKYADPFDLLKEEVQFDEWKNSVKDIFDEKKDGE